MTDIVERLRALLTAAMLPERRAIVEEAADEIEGLTEALKGQRAAYEDVLERQVEPMRDEIERLRADQEGLVYVLGLARGKLAAYRQAHGGEYVGGVEFTELDKLIARALEPKP